MREMRYIYCAFDGELENTIVFIDEEEAREYSLENSNVRIEIFTCNNENKGYRPTYNFYKNGIQVATSQGGSAGLSNQTGLQIGGNYPLHGNVYNFLMYNRTLSSTEILQNYNATKGLFGL
jgi:hypothetical protein